MHLLGLEAAFRDILAGQRTLRLLRFPAYEKDAQSPLVAHRAVGRSSAFSELRMWDEDIRWRRRATLLRPAVRRPVVIEVEAERNISGCSVSRVCRHRCRQVCRHARSYRIYTS